MKRPALSIALALGASLLMTVSAAASSTYVESIHGSELPNATPTEGQFVGEATGSFAGAWYIDVRHQQLNHHPVYITGGSFRLNTVINGRPDAIHGSFTPWHGTVKQLSGFSGCSNQRYAVHGELFDVGLDNGHGSGTFSATLTHYRANIWFVGCVVYSASINGSVSLTF
ncbi:MAG: hypothetical protein M3Z28_04020 [Candidatus Dormibacteraeota bacterium]|nr:hypothetical protein [Candidatus Dormibacteraeota bacterium]